MAQEFAESDRSPTFRSNGSDDPGTPQYEAWVANGFSDYALTVEGWSRRRASSRSTNCARCHPHADHPPRLRRRLERNRQMEGRAPVRAARYRQAETRRALCDVLLRRSDVDGRRDLYYESIDMDDAMHAQTILAYDLNDAKLPVPNGAPIRLRVDASWATSTRSTSPASTCRELRQDRRRQGRLLGGPGISVVRGHLTAVLLAALLVRPRAAPDSSSSTPSRRRGRVLACPAVQPPLLTLDESRTAAHARIERGTRCALEGTCEPGGASKRDPEINDQVRSAIAAERRFADTSVWVTTSRKWATLEGCVRSSAQRSALVRYVAKLPNVERSFDNCVSGGTGAAVKA